MKSWELLCNILWILTLLFHNIDFGFQGDNGNKGNKGEEQQNEDCTQESKSGVYPLLLSYDDAPSYLKFNPYIHSGYRGFLTTKMCLER